MKARDYSINLNYLTASEYARFPDSFEEYKKAVLYLLNIKNRYEFEDDLIDRYKNDSEVQHLMAQGMPGMEAITSSFPDTFRGAGKHPRKEGAPFEQTWYDLWQDYTIIPAYPNYDLFLTYYLRHADLLELDDILNSLLENYYDDNTTFFSRELRLTIRKHGEKLLQPEQIETINEWIAAKEKEATLSGAEETRPKVKIKRSRNDKETVLNQEQTALLIYCLRKTRIILEDGDVLSNTDAGLAFSILTGYSRDTIRQNLSKDEVLNTATFKNAVAVQTAMKAVVKFIDDNIMPEER